MKIEVYIPAERLQPFISKYLILECQEEVVNRVLPNTGLAIAFRLTGQVNDVTGNNTNALPGSVISGLRKSVRLINYLKNSSTIIILFKEAGAGAFFKEPLYELFEESVSLDHVINQQKVSLIEEQLAGAKSNIERVAIVESLLLSRLLHRKTDDLVIDAIRKIHYTKGLARIKELSRSFYISQDAFEKRFRNTVGTSPKQFASIIRMKSLINLKKTSQTLTDLALEGNYFDQSHFNKEFKQFTGQTPADFFKKPSFW